MGLLGLPGARILSNHTQLYGAISAGGPIVSFSWHLSTPLGFSDRGFLPKYLLGAIPGQGREPLVL